MNSAIKYALLPREDPKPRGEPGPFVGRDAVLRQFEQMRDTWSADTVEPIAGPFSVDDLVVMRFRWRGSSHGLDVDMEATVVYGFRAGKVIAADFFWDHEQALAAAGAKGKGGSTRAFATPPRSSQPFGLRGKTVSRENVEIVRGIYAEWERGNFQGALSLFDPEIVFAYDRAQALAAVGLEEVGSSTGE